MGVEDDRDVAVRVLKLAAAPPIGPWKTDLDGERA